MIYLQYSIYIMGQAIISFLIKAKPKLKQLLNTQFLIYLNQLALNINYLIGQQVQMSNITPGGQKIRPITKLLDITQDQRKNVNSFFSKLQVGDLCFTHIMEYALALFGETKAGKTTLAHYLINNPLVGTSNNSYQLRGGSKFLEALIGQTSVSQTEIPNQIQRKVQDKSLHILDCPGYSDSKGCHMVIANGYFHYRIFSKVQNLKFIIAFDYSYMGDVYEKPTRTLLQFLVSFNKYSEIKQQIINATSFVFTKVNKQGKSEQELNGNIEAKLNALRNCGCVKQTSVEPQIQELIDTIIKKKCYFYFERARENYPPTDKPLLQEINSKTTFWSRTIHKEDQQVDLSHIKMTLGNRAHDIAHGNQQFKRDFLVLSQLFQQRIKKAFLSKSNEQNLCSLQKITTQFLTNSILGTAQQKSFYQDYVLQFVQKYNIYTTNEFNSKKQYETKRKHIKDNVLNIPNEIIDKSQIENIQKLQICKMIIDMVQSFQLANYKGMENKGRSVQDFKKLQKKILSVLVQFKKIKFFNLISKEKKNEKQGQYSQKIEEFIYIIYRLLQEIRIFKIIFSLQIQQKPLNLQENENILQNINNTQRVVDYIQSLHNFDFQFISFSDKDIFEKCKLTYLAYHLQVSTDQPEYYYNQLERYFCQIKVNAKGQSQLAQLQKASKLKIDRIKQQKLKTTKGKLNSNDKILTLLDSVLNKLSLLQQQDLQQQKSQLYIEAVNKLAHELTQIKPKPSQSNKQIQIALEYAIKLFKTTNNVYRAIQGYKELVKKYDFRNKTEAHQLKEILVQFAIYASTHGRIELSIQIYQEAYSIIDWMFDKNRDDFRNLRRLQREEISQRIGMLGVDKRYSPSMQYYDSLLKKKLFTIIDKSILDNIKRDFSKK